jgi:flagellar M-ring protein FliF
MITNLTQLGLQLREIWRQLGLNQRLSVAAAAVFVLGGLLGLAFWTSRPDFALLYGRLDDAEAAKVIAAIDEAKVPKEVRGAGSIYVPADKVHALRMQMAARGIPRGGEVGYEIFDKANLGLSDFAQRANYQRALQGELARTISQLDEVEGARVMIVMPENRLFADSQKRATASVFLRVKGHAQMSPQSVSAIRFLVANSVEGLQPNFVAVMDNHGATLAENTENDSFVGLSTTQLTARRNLEQYLSKKAEDMLHRVLGPGQAVVRVSADLNFDTITRTEKKFDPEGQVMKTSTVDDENTDSTTASGGGVAGLATNTSTDTNNAAASPLNNSKVKKKTSTSEYEIGESTSNIMQAAGGIKRLSAAVFVAARMEGTGTDRKVVPRTEDELKRLKTIVQSALGLQLAGDASRADELNLEEMPFSEPVSPEFTKQLDQQQQRDFWWDLAKNLAYPGLALVMLVFFYRAFKSTPAENIPIGIPVGQFAGHGHGHGQGNGHGQGGPAWLKPTEPGIVTVEVLNQLVRENPANMSQAIRTWLVRGKSPVKSN